MGFLFDLLGRFHPLVVHLPIGFLLLGLMMMVYDQRKKRHQKIILFTFFWATLATLLALFTGTFQYLRDGYSWDAVQWHFILGVITFVLSFLMLLKLKEVRFLNRFPQQFIGLSLVLILFLTGHFGGDLTHGKGHLTEPLPPGLKTALGVEVPSKELVLFPETYRELSLYEGVVQPILNQKCVSCHNPKKAKGELMMHNFESLKKGGEEGPVLIAGQPEKSEMLKRMLLPKEDKKHMPPQSKVQLTKAEIALITQWIASGSPPTSTISDLEISHSLFTPFFPIDETGIYPDEEFTPLAANLLDSIQASGLALAPLYKTSSLLKVSAINAPHFDDQKAQLLLLASDHIVDLDLGQTQVTDAVFGILKQLKNLTVLKLDHTSITGSQIEQIKTLEHLKKINLVKTSFSKASLTSLYTFPALQKVYLYGTLDEEEADLIPQSLKSVFAIQQYNLLEESDSSL